MGQTSKIYATLVARFFVPIVATLIIPNASRAAFWIEEYAGIPEEYELKRDGSEITIGTAMVLKAGDKLKVLSDEGKLKLLQDDHAKHKLHTITKTKGNPYTVPESEPPPGIIANLARLWDIWVTELPEEKTETVATISRGDDPVLILGASDLENRLIIGFNRLEVIWTGGNPPYQVRLMDEDDNLIETRTGILEQHVLLTDLVIPVGSYGLEVMGEGSSSYNSLMVVTSDEAPPNFRAVLDSSSPMKIKRQYAIMVLASKPQWRFQALQLADQHSIEHLKLRIVRGVLPESRGD